MSGPNSVLLVAAMWVLSPLRAETRILHDFENGDVRYRALIATDIESTFVQECARAVKSNIKYGRTVIYRSERDARAFIMEASADCRANEWKEFLEANGVVGRARRCPELWEIVKVGTAVVSRRLTSSCGVEVKAISGGTSRIEAGVAAPHEIIGLLIRTRSGGDSSRDGRVRLTVLVQVGAPLSEDLGRDFRVVLDQPGGVDMSVAFRNDARFQRYCLGSPSILAAVLGGPGEAPRRAKIEAPARGNELYCVFRADQTRDACIWWNDQP